MGRRGVVVILLLASCVRSSLVPCGDKVCPDDRLCHADACVTREQLDACAGIDDAQPCGAGETVGYCDRGYCRPARCGDDVVDVPLGEVCDDGNDDNGDMCSADCESLEDCGNGRIDVGTVEQCDDGNRVDGDGCQAGCALPRCGDGIVDVSLDEACDAGEANGNAPDTCRPNCQHPRCGDGVHDPLSGEVCDDGNLLVGDGCRPDCASNETCGNGIVDFAVGEQCDDANDDVRDGCSACLYETFRARVAGLTPSPRSGAAMAYDAARKRTVMFGGFFGPSTRYDETWEWDGQGWVELLPAVRPPPRSATALAYDASRRRVVMFGGAGFGIYDDTWEWDGVRWARLTGPGPSARRAHAMAYDARRGTVVLFGGTDVLAQGLAETWELTAGTWIRRTPLTSPPAGIVSMAYDPVRGEVVVYHPGSGRTFGWDGTNWTERITSNPSSGVGAAFAFDARRARALIVGATTQEWDGSTWIAAVAGPSARSNTAMAYDTDRRELVLFGGASNGVPIGDTWLRANGVWRAFTGPTAPTPRSHAIMSYDPVRARAVLFGGKDTEGTTFNETWEWDGRAWALRTVALPPVPRSRGAMVYDATGRRIVMMGGMDGIPAPRREVHSWNGTTWTSLPLLPSEQANMAAAFDRARGQIVVYGGGTGATGDSEATWIGQNGTWTSATPPARPGRRQSAAMAYDPLTERMVHYGDRHQVDADTWDWDGATWTARPASTLPRVFKSHSAFYDPYRRRTVIVGASNDARTEVWEWEGTRWIESPTTPVITARYRAVTTYDERRGEYVLFGGIAPSGFSGETVIMAWQPNVAGEACTSATIDYDNDGLAGCADPECWSRCTPLCPPGAICSSSWPRCGDASCDASEDCRICPADCGACAAVDCGDLWCDGNESTTCPADC